MDSLLIRNAVNLCLIAAIAFQPGAFAMVGGACGSFGTGVSLIGNGNAVVGCQCAAVGRACKCGRSTTSEMRAVAEQGNTKRAVGAARGCCASRLSGPSIEAGPTDNGVSACMCGLRSEPLAPGTEPLPQSSARSLTLIPCKLEVAYVDDRLDDVSLRENQASPRAKLVPHYTQQFLCIWLI